MVKKVQVNSTFVKASVACYFRYEKQYPFVFFERPLTQWGYKPDVLAITKSRQIIECEVKISLHDLKNDCKKRIWNSRRLGFEVPYQFYYAVPYDLQEKAAEVISEWSKEDKVYGKVGILCVFSENIGLKNVSVIKAAPINKAAKKVSVKQCIIVARHQSGSLCSCMIELAKLQNKNNISTQDYNI